MKTFVKALPGSLLIMLFVYAAVSKLISIDEFRGQMYNQPFPHWMADALVYALPATEIFAAVLLLLPGVYLYGLALSSLMLTVFTGYIGLVLLHFWARVPCSCGGVLSHMSWGTHLFFNICFLILSLSALFVQLKERRFRRSK